MRKILIVGLAMGLVLGPLGCSVKSIWSREVIPVKALGAQENSRTVAKLTDLVEKLEAQRSTAMTQPTETRSRNITLLIAAISAIAEVMKATLAAPDMSADVIVREQFIRHCDVLDIGTTDFTATKTQDGEMTVQYHRKKP